ncbi:MAG: hypothetical protein Q9190_007099 [Brigantiaea leucoxantha]
MSVHHLLSIAIHEDEPSCEEVIDCVFVTAGSDDNDRNNAAPQTWLQKESPHDQSKAMTVANSRLRGTQLALHPKLPLLVVATTARGELRLFGTEDNQLLWCGRLEFGTNLPRTASRSSITVPVQVSCLEFSSGSQLAIGLNTGHLLLLQMNLTKVLNRSPNTHSSSPVQDITGIRLMDIPDLEQYHKMFGAVSNLKFCPTAKDSSTDAWLAITTLNAGLYVWNKRSNQATRLISSRGIAEGCFHWVSLNIQSQDSQYPTQKEDNSPGRSLEVTTISEWENVFGDPDDINMLNNYFALSQNPTRTGVHRTEQRNMRTSATSTRNLPSSNSDRVKLADTIEGFSMMVLSTLEGRIILQRVWHSLRTMHTAARSEFIPGVVVHYYKNDANRVSLNKWSFRSHLSSMSSRHFTPKWAVREVAHLVVNPPTIVGMDVIMNIVVCFQDTEAPIAHTFTVTVPLMDPQLFFPRQLLGEALSFANYCADILLSSVERFWLEDRSFRNLIKAYSSQPLCGRTGSSTPSCQVMSIACPSSSTHMLWTLQKNSESSFETIKLANEVRLPHECLLAASSTEAKRAQSLQPMIPRVSRGRSFGRLHDGYTEQKGYYTSILDRSTVSRRRLDTPKRNQCIQEGSEHIVQYGQIAWGGINRGRELGAYLFWPINEPEDGVGIGMFEVLP